MGRGNFTLRGVLGTAVLLIATASNPVPAIAGSHVIADPAVGPHARDEARHLHDRLRFTLAHSSILSRQPRPVALGAAMVAPATAAPAGPLQREVFGFVPYWELSNNGSWNYSLLSTVAYFGLGINADGSLSTTDAGWAGWNSQDLANIINAAHQAGDRVVVVIKASNAPGASTASTVNQIVTSSGATQAAITSTINAIATKNSNGAPVIDGVNVDFEGTSNGYPDVQSGFTNFITQLSSQVHQRWPAATVTVDTYGGSASWDGGIFNITQLAPIVDGMFVMAYDASFPNTPGQPGPTAPLDGWTYNDALTVSQYLTKAPAKKVMLGVPYYGYKWSTTTNQPYATVVSGTGAEADTYADTLTEFSCALSLSHSWDSVAQSPWASWWSPQSADPCSGNHNSWRELYYDDPSSLGIKYDLVNNNGLLGTGMWALGYDGTSPDLWQVLADKFETTWPGEYRPLTPARILDTRYGIGGFSTPLPGGHSIDVSVAGAGGVPSPGAAAVVVNATVTNATQPSYLSVYPSGAGRPHTSNLNFVGGQTVANLVDVAVGSNGKISVYNNAGSTDVILDVAGWVSTNPESGSAGRLQPLAPARLLDTRSGTGGFRTLGWNQAIDLPVVNSGGVPPSGVSAVVLNLTVTNPSTAGYISAYPTGGTRPNTSNVNFVRGQTVANRAVVQVGAGGKVSLYNCCGPTDLVVDVTGWFTDSTSTVTGGQFTALSPVRIVDTRIAFGGLSSAIAAGTTAVTVSGQATVPGLTAPVSATAVALNVTITSPTAAGYLTVYANGAPRPGTSDLNFTPGQTVANLVIAKLGSDGNLAIFNYAGSTHLIIDVVGWYR